MFSFVENHNQEENIVTYNLRQRNFLKDQKLMDTKQLTFKLHKMRRSAMYLLKLNVPALWV